MSENDLPALTSELQRQLDKADSQLALYARDLKRVVDSERKKTRELAEVNARLEILNRLKSDFLAFISHELRTPLNSMSIVNHFDPGGDSEDQAELIEMIRKGYESLQSFILKGLEYFNWLAVERADASESGDLAAIVHQVAGRMPGLAEPGVDFRILPATAPCQVRGSLEHLSQVVTILLDNALKFSPQGKSIVVSLAARDGRVILSVSDGGIGFEPGLAREIFQPFTIADVRHHSGGTGLNLALAKAIVEAHGGRIEARSEGSGKGATFSVDFPALHRRVEKTGN